MTFKSTENPFKNKNTEKPLDLKNQDGSQENLQEDLEPKTDLKKESKESEMSPEKRIQVIRDFVDLDFEEKFPFGMLHIYELYELYSDKDKEEVRKEERFAEEILRKKERITKEWFKDKSNFEIKEILSKKEIVLIQETISLCMQETREMIRYKEMKEDIKGIIDKEMLPDRFKEFFPLLSNISSYLSLLASKDNFDSFHFEEELKEIEEVKKFEVFPEKKEREPIQIERFEKFDSPEVKGEEFIKQALQFLPQELLGNIKTIRYENKVVSALKEIGIKANFAAECNPITREIIFFKSDKLKKEFFEKFLFNLAHEGGHTLDPRIVSQEELSILEEIQMIKEWEQVRTKEEEFSDYVKKINNKDKITKNWVKSEEDFAETIAMFLINPGHLQGNCPKRFEFCKKWLNKQFPEENFTEVEQRAVELSSQYKKLLEKL